jgi:hypothetical protein
LVSRVWDIYSATDLGFPLAGKLCKFYANAAPTTRSAIQAASQSTFVSAQLHVYTQPEEICKWLCKFGETSYKKKPGATLIQA